MTLDEFRTAQAEEKRCAILDGARRVFIRDGFDGASVQNIADEAGVSTRTIYKHFENKDAILERLIQRAKQRHPTICDPSTLDTDLPPQEMLGAFAADYARLVGSDAWRDLMRVVIAKSGRTPECALTLFENGSCPYIGAVHAYLERQHGLGTLRVPDARLAAMQLTSLISGVVFWPRLFVDTPAPGEEELARVVDEALATFLDRFGALD